MKAPPRLLPGMSVDGRPALTKPTGQWLVARVPTGRTYPCRCHLGQRCKTDPAYGCPCMGRVGGLDQMPAHCCAKRAADTERRNTA